MSKCCRKNCLQRCCCSCCKRPILAGHFCTVLNGSLQIIEGINLTVTDYSLFNIPFNITLTEFAPKRYKITGTIDFTGIVTTPGAEIVRINGVGFYDRTVKKMTASITAHQTIGDVKRHFTITAVFEVLERQEKCDASVKVTATITGLSDAADHAITSPDINGVFIAYF